jgi:hypothetical protein
MCSASVVPVLQKLKAGILWVLLSGTPGSVFEKAKKVKKSCEKGIDNVKVTCYFNRALFGASRGKEKSLKKAKKVLDKWLMIRYSKSPQKSKNSAKRRIKSRQTAPCKLNNVNTKAHRFYSGGPAVRL